MKLRIPPALQRLAGLIDALTLRERAILFAVMLASLFLLADKLLFPSLHTQQRTLEKQINGQLTQLQTVNTQIERIQTESVLDPDAVQRARLEALRSQFAELQLSSASLTRGLVSPREMTRLVHDMLRQNRTLELVKAENLLPEPISLAPSDKAPAAGTGPALYRHGLRVEVKGRYLDIVRYLRTLEQLSWRVDWGQVTITTEYYPVSVASFTLYTISLDKAWIAV